MKAVSPVFGLVLLGILLQALPSEAQQRVTEPLAAPAYGAVAVAPADGSRLALQKVPRNVQRLSLEVFEEQHPLGIHDALNERVGSVTLNAVTANPLQPDLQFRGFTASPLLGTPQGIAVYQNGVRINEAFGDVLQWDLVPVFALHDLEVSPGANPLYGLNALGGSLVLRMKNGFLVDGFRVAALAGAFGRYDVTAELGHRFAEKWAGYVGASVFGERGFRYASPSRALRAFADIRQHTQSREVGLSLTGASTRLTGNGPAPVQLLETDRKEIFTYPDVTTNGLWMASAGLDQRLSEGLSVQANAYLRHLQRDTLNGDEGEFEQCQQDDETVVCDEEGEVLLGETGQPIPSPVAYDGLYNTSRTVSSGYGGWLQLSVEKPLARRENHLIVGSTFDGAAVSFLQRAELGLLNTDRSVTGQNAYLGGSEYRTQLGAYTRTFGVYFRDTFTLVKSLSITASARLNWAQVKLRDREGTALDGVHRYTRVNPALGLAYSPLDLVTVYASYSEANRVPSGAELSCADPDEPCRVPNAFVADPPLDQVVTRTLEVGLRGFFGELGRPPLRWSLAGYAARNLNDILFVAGSRVGTGYFRNASRTRRVGLEADLSGGVGPLNWFASYQFVRATFESALTLPGVNNPAAELGPDGSQVLSVSPGDRMPGVPLHALKAGISVRPLPAWEIALSIIAQSSQPFRGDEANLLDPLPGYAVLNARTSYQVVDILQVFLKAQNLTANRYETFGVLADPSEVLPGLSNPRFVSPGPPVAVWAGLALTGP